MTTTTTAAFALLIATLGCRQEDKGTPATKACCEQPSVPAGVTPFVVVADEVTGPSDGQRVTLRVGLREAATRDQVYPVLHTLYRHAMKRGPFEPIHFTADLFASET